MDTIDSIDFGAELSDFTTKKSLFQQNKQQMLATCEDRKGCQGKQA
jgi:hypothetical protein